MKLAFSTLGCPSWDFPRVIRQAGKMGYQGVEIRGIQDIMRADRLSEFEPRNAARTRELLDRCGVSVVGLGTSAAFSRREDFESSLEEGKKAIDVCRRMGIPFIRVFGDTLETTVRQEESLCLVGEGLSALCDYAGIGKTVVLLEVHGDFNRCETVGPVLRQMKGTENFGILWDIEHSDRAYHDNWYVFYQLIRPYLRHVHIKDYHRKDGRPCLVGEGDIPVSDIVLQLKKDSYQGYFSFEWEKRWIPELEEPETVFPAYRAWMEKLDRDGFIPEGMDSPG